MAEKETIMVLKVDLQCCRCYKKVMKVLAKFPQIRDQIYDKKANTVTITVVCCDPEKLRDKLCCKGGGSIKSIEIKPPRKPKEPKESPPKSPAKKASPPPPAECPPVRCCCTECYHVHLWGPPPCYFGVPPLPPPCYSYGRPVYDNWGGCCYRYKCASLGDCFSDENPQACSVM
ncbi:Detected protein of unknown function [Hibiscus syriacus]|uniref:Uncharacterized protein n=1 Tax=Hibiscus syriacus TaxID=106335 RepID=A0A6A2WQH4_HIBSY|nr:protein PYRICULARIA ORYZAE RESISTANCE 21-like isoform X2 [Hibiscus syriacus]KAE8656500.1 Detected protein of unknown function [Hibiscus syriacus]